MIPREHLTFRALTRLLSGSDPVPARVSDEVIELARRSEVLDVLTGLSGMRKTLGDEAGYFLAQAALGALRLQELKEIAQAVGRLWITLIPLKGMAYSLMFESGGPTRAMADIDLLVRQKDYERVANVMEDLGYHVVFPSELAKLPGHHERCFLRNGRLVEIHQHFSRGRRIRVDYAAVWQRALPLPKDGVSYSRLCPEDTFLYHCFHMGMHEFAFGGLRTAWELRRLILEDRPDLGVASSRAREWGILRMTWCALRLLEYCFPGTLDSTAGRSSDPLRMFAPSLPLRLMLDRCIVEPSKELITSPGLLPRPAQLFRKTLLVDRLSSAVSHLWWYTKAKAFVRFGR